MSIKKKCKKSGKICKVTFTILKEAARGAKSINVVGDFNNWSVKDNPMKKLRSGAFSLDVDLEANREYQFRYLIDENTWENDGDADKFIHSEYGNCENSVISI